MRFVFGYAGIPIRVFDDIAKKKKALASGQETEILLAPPLKSFDPALNLSHVNFLQNKFKETTLKERATFKGRGDHISTIGFAVIYVRTNQENDDTFEEAFFPSTLVFSVDWKLTGYNDIEINKSKNELFDLLLLATTCARAAIKELHKEITERRNTTPLLLPIKNFHSKTLRSLLYQLQMDLANQPPDILAITTIIRKTIALIKNDHPLTKSVNSQKKLLCFLDDRGIEFHSPGSAMHGLPSPTDDHPVTCLLGGYRRLGAPFYAAFHFDCIKGVRGNLKGSFHSCHELDNIIEGNPHLNIAPNDFVR
jgi:hypothetical protein